MSLMEALSMQAAADLLDVSRQFFVRVGNPAATDAAES